MWWVAVVGAGVHNLGHQAVEEGQAGEDVSGEAEPLLGLADAPLLFVFQQVFHRVVHQRHDEAPTSQARKTTMLIHLFLFTLLQVSHKLRGV